MRGALAAHGLWTQLGGTSQWVQDEADALRETVSDCQRKSNLPSEYFAPHIYLMAEFLRNAGAVRQGEETFRALLTGSIRRKQATGEGQFFDPYVSPEDVVFPEHSRPGVCAEPPTWRELSYTGWALVLLAARRGMRHFLDRLWRDITQGDRI